jgi:hypothetical protein
VRGDGEKVVVNVLDPCSSPQDPEMQASVRRLVNLSDDYLYEFDAGGEVCKCCGFGGQPGVASPGYAAYCASERIKEAEADKNGSPYPFVTYCINCRDALRSAGSECYHILELLFGSGDKEKYTVTERRMNRERVKAMFDNDNKDNTLAMTDGGIKYVDDGGLPFFFTPEAWAKMDAQRILAGEVAEVVRHAAGGACANNPERGTISGCKRIGHMTYWVEFIPEYAHGLSGAKVINVWSHRMSIEFEEVWNGEKRDAGR